MSSQTPLRRKLVIVGDGACGKTSLLCTFALGEFPRNICVRKYHMKGMDGKDVELALWDTAYNVTVKWNKEVRPHILVGCKADLRPPSNDPNIDRYVSRAQAERVAQSIHGGVDDVFEVATRASLLMREGVRQPLCARRSGVSDDDDGGRCCVVC
ncbi:hypothetical protein BJV77DRAFT_1061006 [Russula vinacea]|nr:hypothetical protein BJV77DRAFT_1061006 [Russula vinacea]